MHVCHPSVTVQNMTLNSDSSNLPGEPLPDQSIPYYEVYDMMDRLRPFTPLCRAVVVYLVFPLSYMRTIEYDGVSVSIHDFTRIIKFERKSDSSLREAWVW